MITTYIRTLVILIIVAGIGFASLILWQFAQQKKISRQTTDYHYTSIQHLNEVHKEILEIQKYLPEQILYLQPYSSNRVVELAERPPSTEEPVRLFISTTEDLPTVRYVCEIVGWEDKRTLAGWKLNAINRVMFASLTGVR